MEKATITLIGWEKGLARIHKLVAVGEAAERPRRESEGDSCRGREGLAVERGEGASAVQVLEAQMARDFPSNISKCRY